MLVSVLLMSATQLTSIREAKAYNYSLIYAPNYYVGGLDDQYEGTTTNYVTDYIQQLFQLYGQNYNSGTIIKQQDGQAVDSTYFYWACNAELYGDHVAFFSKGHASSINFTGHLEHHYMMDHNGNPVYDRNYGYYTSAGKHTFVFMWHCGTTEDYIRYGNMYCTACNGYSSMPMAFARDNTMSLNGYGTGADTGAHVFVGHKGWSPQFRSNNGLYPGYWYSDFVSYIYQFFLHDHDSTTLALQKACYIVYGGNADFPSTWVGTFKAGWDPDGLGGPLPAADSQMQVIGNGNLGVPGY